MKGWDLRAWVVEGAPAWRGGTGQWDCCFPRGHRFILQLGVALQTLTSQQAGPSGSCKKKSGKGVNVLKRKLLTSRSLAHQRLLSPNLPVCRRCLSLASTPGMKRLGRFALERHVSSCLFAFAARDMPTSSTGERGCLSCVVKFYQDSHSRLEPVSWEALFSPLPPC